ncbi:hypothetical protein C1H46_045839 [Malus baccata]|uniref:Uncharacterized protein n=1 Tax=Malus baccata TaxID=106549 RepID=A0A540K2Z0_MALBA|nr:hypothetical protein C1H46_045839 [Malus baccata]
MLSWMWTHIVNTLLKGLCLRTENLHVTWCIPEEKSSRHPRVFLLLGRAWKWSATIHLCLFLSKL